MDQDPEAMYFLYWETCVVCGMGCMGTGGPGTASCEALCHSHSPAEALADGPGGLAPYASSYGSLDAPAKKGLEHLSQVLGGCALSLLRRRRSSPSLVCFLAMQYSTSGEWYLRLPVLCVVTLQRYGHNIYHMSDI